MLTLAELIAKLQTLNQSQNVSGRCSLALGEGKVVVAPDGVYWITTSGVTKL